MPKIFLYGPDSLQGRVYDKIGSSEVIGGAMLRGYTLTFNKPNMKEKREGLPNLVESSTEMAFGVLYELSRKQIEMLDGYYGGYERKSVRVTPQPADEEGTLSMRTHECDAHFARRTRSGLKPSQQTKEMSIKGAEENGAPKTFLDWLNELEVFDG